MSEETELQIQHREELVLPEETDDQPPAKSGGSLTECGQDFMLIPISLVVELTFAALAGRTPTVMIEAGLDISGDRASGG